jgi:hypothetical protein
MREPEDSFFAVGIAQAGCWPLKKIWRPPAKRVVGHFGWRCGISLTGGRGRLKQAAAELAQMGIEVVVLTETKFVND